MNKKRCVKKIALILREKGTNWDSRHGADHEDVLSKIICSDGNWIFNEETKTWEEETA